MMKNEEKAREGYGDMNEDPEMEEEVTDRGKRSYIRRYLPFVLPVLLVQAVAAYLLVTKVIAPRVQHAQRDGGGIEEMGEVYIVKDVITNPAETAGTRFLNVTVGLEVRDKKALNELKRRGPQVRDILIDILSSRTIAQLSGTDNRRSLREEILARMNGILGGERLVNVYFVDFVLQ